MGLGVESSRLVRCGKDETSSRRRSQYAEFLGLDSSSGSSALPAVDRKSGEAALAAGQVVALLGSDFQDCVEQVGAQGISLAGQQKDGLALALTQLWAGGALGGSAAGRWAYSDASTDLHTGDTFDHGFFGPGASSHVRRSGPAVSLEQLWYKGPDPAKSQDAPNAVWGKKSVEPNAHVQMEQTLGQGSDKDGLGVERVTQGMGRPVADTKGPTKAVPQIVGAGGGRREVKMTKGNPKMGKGVQVVVDKVPVPKPATFGGDNDGMLGSAMMMGATALAAGALAHLAMKSKTGKFLMGAAGGLVKAGGHVVKGIGVAAGAVAGAAGAAAGGIADATGHVANGAQMAGKAVANSKAGKAIAGAGAAATKWTGGATKAVGGALAGAGKKMLGGAAKLGKAALGGMAKLGKGAMKAGAAAAKATAKAGLAAMKAMIPGKDFAKIMKALATGSAAALKGGLSFAKKVGKLGAGLAKKALKAGAKVAKTVGKGMAAVGKAFANAFGPENTLILGLLMAGAMYSYFAGRGSCEGCIDWDKNQKEELDRANPDAPPNLTKLKESAETNFDVQQHFANEAETTDKAACVNPGLPKSFAKMDPQQGLSHWDHFPVADGGCASWDTSCMHTAVTG